MTDEVFRAVMQELTAEVRLLRGAVERILETPEEEPDPQPAECQHPEDTRIDFGMTGGRHDFQCGLCGYRSIEAAYE